MNAAVKDEDAISIARTRLSALFAEDGITDIRLEEIARKSKKGWNITFSFYRKSKQSAAMGDLAKLFPPDWQREWKLVEVNNNGEVVAILNG
jgi:formate-dependent nitrite reductase cytochrome c552 subunit